VNATYVFVQLTDYQDRVPIALRIDQIVAVTARPKRNGIQRDIDVLTQRLTQYPPDVDRLEPLHMVRVDRERDEQQLAELQRELDEPHRGSRIGLLAGGLHTVAESPIEVVDLMQRAFTGVGQFT
jgi:hypothetical protein